MNSRTKTAVFIHVCQTKFNYLYLFIGQVELLAELHLVLGSQVSVFLEGPLQVLDLLGCESGPRPPAHRGRRRRGGGAVGVGGRWQNLAPFALVPGGLLFSPTAETTLCDWETKNVQLNNKQNQTLVRTRLWAEFLLEGGYMELLWVFSILPAEVSHLNFKDGEKNAVS